MLLFVELVLGVLEVACAFVDLSGRDVEVFVPRLGLQLSQHALGAASACDFSCSTVARCTESSIASSGVALVHAWPFGRPGPGDRAGDLRIDVDVFAVRLVAFDDAVRVDPVGE